VCKIVCHLFGVVCVVEVQSIVGTVIFPPAAHCIHPIRGLRGSVVLDPTDLDKRVAKVGLPAHMRGSYVIIYKVHRNNL